MLALLVPAAIALGGGYLFITRGKANIGDTVDVNYKPGGSFGDQGLIVQGKVTEKTNPILGPYYSVQLFQTPKGVNIANLAKGDIPFDMTNPDEKPMPLVSGTLSGLKDSDIVRNLSRK